MTQTKQGISADRDAFLFLRCVSFHLYTHYCCVLCLSYITFIDKWERWWLMVYTDPFLSFLPDLYQQMLGKWLQDEGDDSCFLQRLWP